MRKRSESDPSGPKLAELLDALRVRLLVLGSHTLENAKHIKTRGKRVTAPAEEAKRGFDEDPDTRKLNPSSSSTDPKPKRSETDTCADVANTPDQIIVDSFPRSPANAHLLESAGDENVSKKARVARNVLHIRGESELKFDVNEEAWPNADLAIRSSSDGALIVGLPADKVKAGDEREIRQMKDLQMYFWIKKTNVLHEKLILLTGWARRRRGMK